MQNISPIEKILTFLSLAITFNSFSQDNQYEVYALKFAERLNKIPIAVTAIGTTSKDSTEMCYMIWLLKGKNGKLILVDAGFRDTAGIPGMRFIRPDSIQLKLNINPGDITDIILTHPHWDHIGGIDLFPNAMVWMQKEDYNYLVTDAWQEGGNSGGFNRGDVQKILQKKIDQKLSLVKGDNIEIFLGIKVFISSKYTFELQFVLVNTATDKVVIASDNCKYYFNAIHLLSITATLDRKGYVKNLS